MLQPNSLPSIPAETVADQLSCDAAYLQYYAWPQVFGSTAGPFGGVGGAAITSFIIEAWHDGGGQAVLFSRGRIIKTTSEFTPLMVV